MAATSPAMTSFALLQLDRLVLAVVVDGRAPDLVRGLMFGAAVAELGAQPEIKLAHGLERIDELFGVEMRAGLLQRLDQHAGRHISLERDVVGCLTGEIFDERV